MNEKVDPAELFQEFIKILTLFLVGAALGYFLFGPVIEDFHQSIRAPESQWSETIIIPNH